MFLFHLAAATGLLLIGWCLGRFSRPRSAVNPAPAIHPSPIYGSGYLPSRVHLADGTCFHQSGRVHWHYYRSYSSNPLSRLPKQLTWYQLFQLMSAAEQSKYHRPAVNGSWMFPQGLAIS